MSHAPALEHRYRRLLACYPAEHRRTYAEEMIGVLLASAADGQRRPSLRESIDLIAGAAKVRLRRVLAGSPDPGWRDALAVTSLLAPFLLAILLLGQDLGWMASLLWPSGMGSAGAFRPIWPALVLLAPVALALIRLRWVAAATTAALMTGITVRAAMGQQLIEPRFAAYLVLLGVEVAALATSDGPRRGLQLISAKAVLLALPWLAVAAYAAGIIPGHYPVPLILAEIFIAALALAALPALASPRGRRILVLLAGIPGSAFIVSLLTFAQVDFYSLGFAASQVALYLPPAILAGLAVIAIRRSARAPLARS
jgi:hypothetical protein